MSAQWKPWISAAVLALLLGGCAMQPRQDSAMADARDPAAAAALATALVPLRAGQYDKAVTALRPLTAEYPRYSGPWANLGIALARLGRDAEAETALRQALALKAAAPEVHNELGMLHRRAGRFAEARAAYATALAAAPDFPLAHRNLGVLCDLYLSDLDCALTHYQAYARLAPPDDKEIELWIADLQQRLTAKQ